MTANTNKPNHGKPSTKDTAARGLEQDLQGAFAGGNASRGTLGASEQAGDWGAQHGQQGSTTSSEAGTPPPLRRRDAIPTRVERTPPVASTSSSRT